MPCCNPSAATSSGHCNDFLHPQQHHCIASASTTATVFAASRCHAHAHHDHVLCPSPSLAEFPCSCRCSHQSSHFPQSAFRAETFVTNNHASADATRARLQALRMCQHLFAVGSDDPDASSNQKQDHSDAAGRPPNSSDIDGKAPSHLRFHLEGHHNTMQQTHTVLPQQSLDEPSPWVKFRVFTAKR
jgi:hypothetical protein